MPGMQNPHCTPPHRTKLSASCLRVSSATPSSVVTVFPATCDGFIVEESLGFPSTSNVQHPHDACGSHPSLIELNPKSSRRTCRSDRPLSVVCTSLPFS